MDKIAVLTVLVVLASATALAYTQYQDREPNLENEHFEIKIVSEYPSQGGLEALNKVEEGEKRTMVLRTTATGNLKQRCQALYGASRTEYPPPCYMLN